MTPQLRQAIKMLQLSNIDLNAYVDQEMESNPLLEKDAASDDFPENEPSADPPQSETESEYSSAELGEYEQSSIELSSDADHDGSFDYSPVEYGTHLGEIPASSRKDAAADATWSIDELRDNDISMRDRLGEQLRLTFDDPIDRLIGTHLIALLCPAGRLTAEPLAIAQTMKLSLERVEAVRCRMMQFDPVGLFARDLQECLEVQAAISGKMNFVLRELLRHLDLLARRDVPRLVSICGVGEATLKSMIDVLKSFNPKPGAVWDNDPIQVVVPDLFVRPSADGGWIVELNSDVLPRLIVNEGLYSRVLPGMDREDRVFLTEKINSANWLVKSLQQRSQTILNVATEIVRQQDGFLRLGVTHLRPLILRDIAAAVNLHESTVSRVTANKYIATPRGTFELKYFFSTAIAGSEGVNSHSSESVRYRIRKLIETEKVDDTLSDDTIVDILRREGVDIARRTVAKYRESLRIPNSVQRRREKRSPF